MMKPEISVIVPVYNAEKHLGACIGSILGQTFSDIELIVLDDRSTDSSPLIVEEYRKRDERLRFIKLEENGGQGRARNIGIEKAEGSYLSFVDADDFISPDFLELLHKKALESGADIVKGLAHSVPKGVSLSDDARHEIKPINERIRSSVKSGKRADFCFDSEHWSAIYKRDFILEHGILYGESRIHQDTTFLVRVAACSPSIETVDEAVYYYIQREGSSVHKFSAARFDAALDAYEEQFETISASSAPRSTFLWFGYVMLLHALAAQKYLETRLPQQQYRKFCDRVYALALKYPYIEEAAAQDYAVDAFIRSGGRENISIIGRVFALEDNTLWQLDALESLIDRINGDEAGGMNGLAYLENSLSWMYNNAFVDAHTVTKEMYQNLSERVRECLLRVNNKEFLFKRCPRCCCLVKYGKDVFPHQYKNDAYMRINALSALVAQISKVNAIIGENDDARIFIPFARSLINSTVKFAVNTRKGKESRVDSLIAVLAAEAEKLSRISAAGADE